jgi:hypothetical protein
MLLHKFLSFKKIQLRFLTTNCSVTFFDEERISWNRLESSSGNIASRSLRANGNLKRRGFWGRLLSKLRRHSLFFRLSDNTSRRTVRFTSIGCARNAMPDSLLSSWILVIWLSRLVHRFIRRTLRIQPMLKHYAMFRSCVRLHTRYYYFSTKIYLLF